MTQAFPQDFRDRVQVRRLKLAPGEAMPWHIDPCHRHTVVLSGKRLAIEFRDGTPAISVEVYPGLADWDVPELRPHRAVNVGSVPYEEVVVFLLDQPGQDPQPTVA